VIVAPFSRRGASLLGPAAAALLVVACIVGACALPGQPSSSAPASPGETAPSAAPSTPGPVETPGPGTPSGSPSPAATPGGPLSPGPGASPGAAGACTGSADNRSFYAALAAAVDWAVYCPVLPPGWFVDSGEFRQSNGGRLEIAYKGPAGGRLELRQGTFCAGRDGCLLGGSDAGTASFGGRPARLLDHGDGTWVVVADEVAVAWEVHGIGLDGPTLAALAAAFALVEP